MNPSAVRRAIARADSPGTNGRAPKASGNLSTDGIKLARLGYSIVPGHPGQKRPTIRTGPQHSVAATTDEATILSWAKGFPDADVLIVAKASGIVVFDGDSKAGFDADAWVEEHPDYVHVRTGVAPPPDAKYPDSREGMRGVQTYFRGPDAMTFTGDIAEQPGAEFRGPGALVVAPGGRHKSGVLYEGDLPARDELPLLPDFMRAWTPRSRNGSTATAEPVVEGELIPAGGGMHNHLWDFAVSLVAQGLLDTAAIESELISEHETRSVPGDDYGDYLPKIHVIARDAANGTVAASVRQEIGVRVVNERDEEDAQDAIDAVRGLPDYPPGVFRGRTKAQFDEMVTNGLPAAFAAASMAGAVSVVLGNSSRTVVNENWQPHPGIWPVSVGLPSSGKSVAHQIAFAPIFAIDAALSAEYDVKLAEYLEWKASKPRVPEYKPAPVESQLTAGNSTFESFLQSLHENTGTLSWVVDELSGMLLSLGHYKNGVSPDAAWLLETWTQSPMKYGRVTGARRYRFPRPAVSVVGTLTFANVPLLGDIGSGQAPRFLLHAANPSGKVGAARTLPGWHDLINELYEYRSSLDPDQWDRRWRFPDDSRELLDAKRAEWIERERDPATPPAEAAALGKAPEQTIRFANVLAEMDEPGKVNGLISVDVLDRAAREVEFNIAGWKEIPSSERFQTTYQDKPLDDGVDQLQTWLRGRSWTRASSIRRAKVAAVRIPKQMNLLLNRYQETHPHKVRGVHTPTVNGKVYDKREFHE